MHDHCISCTSKPKFWVRDGAFTKSACTYHMISFRDKGYKVWPMSKKERERRNG